MIKRIAMWSGPRNLSTALMRSWGSRPDTFVCDEPLYGHYLLATGDTRHPDFAVTIGRHETDWRKSVEWLLGPVPEGKSVFYQKHMAHHLLPGMELDWIDGLTTVLLIRDPYEMLTSLIEFLPDPRPEDTGLPQQVALLDRLRAAGREPPAIDAADLLADPPRVLSALCDRVDVPYDDAMLHWEPGLRPTDGAWAPFWYNKIVETTGFSPHRPAKAKLPERLAGVWRACQALYDKLSPLRIS
jgi:hypothetical protein